MTERSEGLVQLSRLLGDVGLRFSSPEAARAAVRTGRQALLDGLVNEAAQSDDVFDIESALRYVEERLRSLSDLVDEDLRRELRDAATEQIEKW